MLFVYYLFGASLTRRFKVQETLDSLLIDPLPVTVYFPAYAPSRRWLHKLAWLMRLRVPVDVFVLLSVPVLSSSCVLPMLVPKLRKLRVPESDAVLFQLSVAVMFLSCVAVRLCPVHVCLVL